LVGNYPAQGGNGTVYLGDGSYGAVIYFIRKIKN
jgi:hypothetical protein